MDYVYNGCLDLHPHSKNNPEQVSTRLRYLTANCSAFT